MITRATSSNSLFSPRHLIFYPSDGLKFTQHMSSENGEAPTAGGVTYQSVEDDTPRTDEAECPFALVDVVDVGVDKSEEAEDAPFTLAEAETDPADPDSKRFAPKDISRYLYFYIVASR
jgi:hypothetical protein